jgi:hypothetical protein
MRFVSTVFTLFTTGLAAAPVFELSKLLSMEEIEKILAEATEASKSDLPGHQKVFAATFTEEELKSIYQKLQSQKSSESTMDIGDLFDSAPESPAETITLINSGAQSPQFHALPPSGNASPAQSTASTIDIGNLFDEQLSSAPLSPVTLINSDRRESIELHALPPTSSAPSSTIDISNLFDSVPRSDDGHVSSAPSSTMTLINSAPASTRRESIELHALTPTSSTPSSTIDISNLFESVQSNGRLSASPVQGGAITLINSAPTSALRRESPNPNPNSRPPVVADREEMDIINDRIVELEQHIADEQEELDFLRSSAEEVAAQATKEQIGVVLLVQGEKTIQSFLDRLAPLVTA